MAYHSLAWLLDHLRDDLRQADASLRCRSAHRMACGMPRMAEWSMSIDCRIGYRRYGFGRSRDLVVQWGRSRLGWLDRRPVRRLGIVCLAEFDWRPQIDIDGHRVDLPPCSSQGTRA